MSATGETQMGGGASHAFVVTILIGKDNAKTMWLASSARQEKTAGEKPCSELAALITPFMMSVL